MSASICVSFASDDLPPSHLLDNGRSVVLGTEDGVYFAELREGGREPVKMLQLPDVTQVDILEDYQLLVVLSGEHLSSRS